MIIIRIFNDIFEYTLSEIVSALDGAKDGDDITIQICSAGGLVYYAYAIIDYLRARHFKTTAEVYGMAASAAAILSISCDRVKMAPYASLMFHSAYAMGDPGIDPGIKQANDIQMNIIHKRNPGYSEIELNKDTWYGAEAALKAGFADEIITDANDIAAFCNIYVAQKTKEVRAMADEKRVCAEDVKESEEVKEAEDIKAEDGVSLEDVMEALVKRLDEIEHRLAVLEGEGKKADDEEAPDEDPVMARRKALYAKINKVATPSTIPAPVMAKSEPKKSNIDLNGFIN